MESFPFYIVPLALLRPIIFQHVFFTFFLPAFEPVPLVAFNDLEQGQLSHQFRLHSAIASLQQQHNSQSNLHTNILNKIIFMRFPFKHSISLVFKFSTQKIDRSFPSPLSISLNFRCQITSLGHPWISLLAGKSFKPLNFLN